MILYENLYLHKGDRIDRMTSFKELALKIGLGLLLLSIGFILLVSGIDTKTLQITNVYYLGIGIILMIGGGYALKK